MKALVVDKPNGIKLTEIEMPTISENQVLVKVEYALICSSDIKLIAGDFHGLKYPVIPGHEFSGVIVESKDKFKNLIGKKVVVDTLMPCRQCDMCKKGKFNLCLNLEEIGITKQGAFAEYVVANVENIQVLQENTCLKSAALIEPLAVAYNCINRVIVKPNDKIAIIGTGALGLLNLALLSKSTANEIVCIDYNEERLSVAKRISECKTIKREKLSDNNLKEYYDYFDLVIDTSGTAEGFKTALDLVGPSGTIGYISYAGSEKIEIEPSKIMLKEITIKGVLSPTLTWQQSKELIEKELININSIVTHEFAIEEYRQALDMMEKREAGIVRAAFRMK